MMAMLLWVLRKHQFIVKADDHRLVQDVPEHIVYEMCQERCLSQMTLLNIQNAHIGYKKGSSIHPQALCALDYLPPKHLV